MTMQRWADTMDKPRFSGGLQREDHVRKTRAVAACSARTPCLPGEAHHYRIPEPDGRHTLPGTCRKCGATREFVMAGDTDWFREESRQGKGRNGGAK